MKTTKRERKIPIFDKEKEQQRLQEAQLIAEIGSQVGDIARTQGQIEATKAANEKISGATRSDRDEDVSKQVYNNFYNQAFNESGFGTGDKVQQAIQAATAAVQGLAGGDLAKAIAGGTAPYIASVIGSSGLDDAGKVLAHAAVNAALMTSAQKIMNTWGYHKSNASIGDSALIFGSSVLGNTIREGMVLNAAIGVGVNSAAQLCGNDPFSYVDAIMAGVTAAAATGKGIFLQLVSIWVVRQ